MAIARVIDASGGQKGERELPEDLFGGEINVPLMHQVEAAQLAEARSGTSSTKTRSEVRGGGQKPWRQKGTGRARHGSIRSPLWVGGGTVFGPRPRSYAVQLPKKMRRAALRSALASKAGEGRVWVMDGFEETKTKAAALALANAGIKNRVLLVLDQQDPESSAVDRAFRNLRDTAFSLHGSLSTHDVLVADAVIFTPASLDAYSRRSTSPGEAS